jgi:hypothetical protein
MRVDLRNRLVQSTIIVVAAENLAAQVLSIVHEALDPMGRGEIQVEEGLAGFELKPAGVSVGGFQMVFSIAAPSNPVEFFKRLRDLDGILFVADRGKERATIHQTLQEQIDELLNFTIGLRPERTFLLVPTETADVPVEEMQSLLCVEQHACYARLEDAAVALGGLCRDVHARLLRESGHR